MKYLPATIALLSVFLPALVLLGGVASRFPHTDLAWEAKALKFDNAEANAHVGLEYREGWEIPSLG